MPWTMQTRLTAIAGAVDNSPLKNAAIVLGYEFARLVKQRCAYCDGYGHSGNDCPTDSKIAQLRGGILEANQAIQLIRK